MLIQRILTALLLTPLAVLIILLPERWTAVFALIVGVVFLAAQWEWTRLAGLRAPLGRALMLLATAVVLVALWLGRDVAGLWPAVIAAGVAGWAASLLWLRRYSFAAAPSRENRAFKLVAGMLVLVPAWVALVRVHGSEPDGRWWTLLALVLVWAADTGAYFSGRAFGRRKLAPRISPGKTWAGVYGALCAGALVAAGFGWLLQARGASLAGLVLLGLCTVVASIVGDLLESLMKRHADIKDSGALFPGHGGLLDRLDSVFAALPVFVAGLLLLGL